MMTVHTITVLGNGWGLLPISQVLIHLQWLLSLPKKQTSALIIAADSTICTKKVHLGNVTEPNLCPFRKHAKSIYWHPVATKKDKSRKQEQASCTQETQTPGQLSGGVLKAGAEGGAAGYMIRSCMILDWLASSWSLKWSSIFWFQPG